MALTDKLTAIANAVRAKTGRQGTLTLPQMAAEISSLPTGSEYSRCWVINLAENSAAGAVISIAQNDWLAAQYNNSTLSAALVRMGTVPNGSAYIKACTQSNAASGGNCIRCNLSGNAETVANVLVPVSSTSSTKQGFSLDSTGTLSFYCKDGGYNLDVLPAGKWMVIVAVEAES